MHFSELFGVIFVAQLFIAELLAGKVKNAVTYNIVAVIIAAAALSDDEFLRRLNRLKNEK